MISRSGFFFCRSVGMVFQRDFVVLNYTFLIPLNMCALYYIHYRMDGPCLAPWVGLFLMTWLGIDKASYLALFNCRFLPVSCMHLPHVQQIMPPSQYEAQSRHCT